MVMSPVSEKGLELEEQTKGNSPTRLTNVPLLNNLRRLVGKKINTDN